MKMAVLWARAPCSRVEVHRCFRGTCCHTTWLNNPEDSNFQAVTGSNVGKLILDYGCT
jgi:hypothetical protein